jgi:hypothetical protein
MSQYITKTPFAIASGVQEAVIPSDDDADDISVRGLRKVEDPCDFGAARRRAGRQDRLLASQQIVQTVATRGARIGDRGKVIRSRDRRECLAWRRHRIFR